ncbi:hypothetical protein GQ43DRAFT_475016 [Delitschia confertaspora ATCC 74209]|uniref:C2H2-type domain-containing protein n=1 Tax=Delitschia confertaspora ATCC 74209 TaxID=1513339 RepID=A0A9P4JEG7_9PLEO|nr:hypothetical protein GQ43DRAFT_475016 [Delitschia confertaspora ATCC 74209]
MVSRQDTAFSKLYCGNVLLYDYLNTKRAPLFLNRNLKRALQAHQEESESAKAGSSVGFVAREIIPRESWTYPREETEDMVRYGYEEKKTFSAVVKILKPVGEDGKAQMPLKDLKALPLRVPCQFGLSIWDPDSAAICCKPTRNAEIVARQTGDGTNVFSVEMHEAFRESISEWPDHDKRALAAGTKYATQLSLNFLNGNDSYEFLSHLQPGKWYQHGDTPTRFIAKWPNLPEVPKDGELLLLQCSGGPRVVNLGVEVEMRWGRARGETLLTHWNHQLKAKSAKIVASSSVPGRRVDDPKFTITYNYPSGNPPPPSSMAKNSKGLNQTCDSPIHYEGLRCGHCSLLEFASLKELRLHLQNRHTFFDYSFREGPLLGNTVEVEINSARAIAISYSFPDLEDSVAFYDLKCPHCPHTVFATLDELRMHLGTHDKFRYKYEREGTTTDLVLKVRFVGMLVQNHTSPRARDHTSSVQGVSIVAPQRPFDQQQYLNNKDEDGAEDITFEKTKSKQRMVPNVTTAVKRKVSIMAKSRTQPIRKKFQVPKVSEGITIFRLSSKQPLVEGEWVDESDDDVDMTSLKLKKAADTMSNTRMPFHVRKFIKEWDDFIVEERLCSDMHLGDAILRFVGHAQKEGLLRDPLFVAEFQYKLDELHEDKIITPAVHNRVSELFHEFRADETEQVEEPAIKRLRRDLNSTLSANATPRGSPKSSNPTIRYDRLDCILSHTKGKGPKGKDKAMINSHDQTTPQLTHSDSDVNMDSAGAAVRPLLNGSRGDMVNKMIDKIEEHPPDDRCICGESALTSVYERQALYCQNILCVRGAFHLDCVMERWDLQPTLTPAALDWICPKCEKDPASILRN